MRRPHSIRARLTLVATAAVLAIALLVCALAWVAMRQTLVRQVDQQLQATAAGPVSLLAPAIIAAIPSTPLAGSAGIRIQVRLPGGRMVSAPSNVARLPFSETDKAVAAGKIAEASYTTGTAQGQFRVLTLRGKHGETIQLARSLSDVNASLDRVGALMIILVLGAAAVAAVAGQVVALTGLGPVSRLTRAATHIASTQDLRGAIQVAGRDEVAQLGHAFNSMLTALDRSKRAQQELIEDAAHELRTPMSSMRTNIELLVRACGRLSAADQDALVGDLDTQSSELADLIADLVILARSAGTDEPAEPVQLAEVLADALRRVGARGPQVTFRVRSEPVTIVGQAAAVERAMVNLLDNAVKFGPSGQVIDVRLASVGEASAACAEISVADRGPGIPDAERERVFHRFHRLDAARSVPGSGLGLAIVRKTALSHGGTVTVAPRLGGGSTFTLRLPVAA
jgi:two-component system, OmpR family, sensor histidine kinase MprB